MHNGSSQLEQVASSKRRRQDQDYSVYVAPSTSRTAKQAANGRAAEAARTAQLKKDDSVHTPLLDLATLPPASLQRYLSRYGLLEAHGSLSYHHAVFPVPPLPSSLVPPLTGRVLNKTRSKPAHTLRAYEPDSSTTPSSTAPTAAILTQQHHDHIGATTTSSVLVPPSSEPHSRSSSAGGARGEGGRGRKRVWQEPKTVEFADLTAYDDPQLVVERLAQRAKAHWDKKDSVKEGETLTNFIFALRMRGSTLALNI